MKIRLVLFAIGVGLFIVSLPVGIPMTMEYFHKLNMQSKYDITNINDDQPPESTTYIFNDNTIDINESMSDAEVYLSPWDNKIGQGDIVISVDGEQIDLFPAHPIRIDEEGLNRYFGEVAYLLVRDRRSDDSYFVVVGKKTKELIKEMPNGDIVGYVPEEELDYAVHTLDLNGHVKSEIIHFTDLNGYQTELLNRSGVLPYRVGYYTDLLDSYPSLFFPIIYPFITFISGLGLVIIFFPRKQRSH